MTPEKRRQLTSLASSIEKWSADKRLRPILRDIQKAAMLMGDTKLATSAESLEAKLFYMLRLMSPSSANLPKEDKLAVANLAKDTFFRIRQFLAEDEPTDIAYGQLRFMRMRPEENLESLVSDYLAELSRLRTDTAALLDSRANATLERLSEDIFKRLWVEYPLSLDVCTLIESLISDTSVPAHDREVWLHAIALGTTRLPEQARLRLLENAYGSPDSRISIAAAVWLVLLSFSHDVPSISSRDTTLVLSEIYRALALARSNGNAEGLSKLMDLGRKMSDRLQGRNPADVDPAELMSPDMDTAGYEAMKDFIESQQRGDDVFGATLGKARGYEFFNHLSNWFLPFHTNHSSLAAVVDGEGAALADTVTALNVLCDSDKFSLLLSLAAMPPSMRTNALTGIVDQLHAASGTEEYSRMMEAQNKRSRKELINNSVRNLFRFFEGYHARSSFEALFDFAWKSTSEVPTKFHIDSNDIISIGDIIYAKGHLKQAASFYGSEKVDTTSLTLAQRMRMAEALTSDNTTESQEKAMALFNDIIAENPSIRHAIAGKVQLLMENKEYGKAAEFLNTYISHFPEDTELLATLGDALEKSRQTQKAIEVFHKLDYILPAEDTTAKARLAELLTMANSLEEADIYFEAIESSGLPRHSSLLRAMQLWLLGRPADALRCLIAMGENNANDLIAALEAERTSIAKAKSPLSENPLFPSLSLLSEAADFQFNKGSYGSLI